MHSSQTFYVPLNDCSSKTAKKKTPKAAKKKTPKATKKKMQARPTFFQRTLINDENFRAAAASNLDSLCPGFRNEATSFAQSKLSQLCEALWNNDAIRATIKQLSTDTIHSKVDLQHMFEARAGQSTSKTRKTWFMALIMLLKTPSVSSKTAIANEEAKRGLFGSLPKEVQNVRKMKILDFVTNSPW